MARNGQPTMDDVAARAGVSKSAVSLVLNNKPGTSAKLRNAVLKAADDLAYRLPDRRPTNSSPQSSTITVIVCAEQDAATSDITGIFIEYLRGVRRYVREKQLNITLISGYREDDPGNLAAQLLEGEDAFEGGVILVGMYAASRLVHRIVRQRVPAVALSRQWPQIAISTVSQDHAEQTLIALRHLVALGHTRIGFIAADLDRSADWCQWRLATYREFVGTLSDGDEAELVSFGRDGNEATKLLLSRSPGVTAIFGVHCGRAIEAIDAAYQLNRIVPDDLSVIAVGDSARSPQGRPGLTTVGFPAEKVGYLAAESLHRQISDLDITQTNILVRSTLIERESCAPPRRG